MKNLRTIMSILMAGTALFTGISTVSAESILPSGIIQSMRPAAKYFPELSAKAKEVSVRSFRKGVNAYIVVHVRYNQFTDRYTLIQNKSASGAHSLSLLIGEGLKLTNAIDFRCNKDLQPILTKEKDELNGNKAIYDVIVNLNDNCKIEYSSSVTQKH